MKRITAIFLVLILTLICFSGCGKDSDNGKVTLHIGVPGGASLTPMELIEEFKAANPDINVTTDEAPWNDFRTKLDMQLGGNNAPDVFITDSGHATSIASKGILMDLSGKIDENINKDDYISSLFALSDEDGKVWGVPHAINSQALYYNKEIFDKAGLEYPNENWTWDDMLEAAKTLTTKPDATGTSDVYGLGIGYSMTLGWYPVVLATGGSPLNDDRTESNFNDPKTIEGIKKFEEIVKSGVTPPLAWYTAKGGAAAAFYQGNLAMAILQSNSAAAIIENNPDLKFDVTNIPYGWDGDRNTVYVPNVWVVNGRSSKAEQEAAWKWLEFYLSEETQLKLAEKCLGGYPVNKKALDLCSQTTGVPENKAVFYNSLDESGITLSENASWAVWSAEANEIFKDLYNGMINADEAAKRLHQKVSEALK